MKAPDKPACCSYGDCTETDIGLSYRRSDQTLHWVCDLHDVDIIESERADSVEYIVHCPHCECGFGVN